MDFKKNYRCFYPHRLRDSVSPVCRINFTWAQTCVPGIPTTIFTKIYWIFRSGGKALKSSAMKRSWVKCIVGRMEWYGVQWNAVQPWQCIAGLQKPQYCSVSALQCHCSALTLQWQDKTAGRPVRVGNRLERTEEGYRGLWRTVEDWRGC